MFRSVTFFLQVIGKALNAATLYSHCSFIMLNTHVFYASNMVVVRRFEITLTCSMYDDFKVLNSVICYFKGKVFSLLGESIILR